MAQRNVLQYLYISSKYVYFTFKSHIKALILDLVSSFDTSGTSLDMSILIWTEIVLDLGDESQFRCLIDATRW